jgi:hypothetical protein
MVHMGHNHVKTSKTSIQVVFWITVAVNVAALVWTQT